MHLLLLLILRCSTLDIDHFVDKEIRVFFSSANHVFLGLNTAQLTARSKHYDLKGFSTVAKIVPDSSYYRIRFRSDPICVTGESIETCEMGTSWTINQKVFGYTIGDGSKCITLVERSVLKMMPCTESSDQIFDFRLKSEDQECGQDGEFKGKEDENKDKDPHRDIMVIHVDNKSPAHDYHHQKKHTHGHVYNRVVGARPIEKRKLTYIIPDPNPHPKQVDAPKKKKLGEDENDDFLKYAHQQSFEDQK